MPEKTIEQKIKDILVENVHNARFTANEIARETPLANDLPIDMDSLDFVEVIMAIEEEFDLEIPDEETDKFHNVGDLCRYVEERRS